MTSIRRFLVIVLLATITLFNFVAALQGYRTSIRNAEVLFDEQLHDLAELLSAGDFNGLENSHPDTSHVFFQIWRGNTLVQHSANAPTVAVVVAKPGFHDATHLNYRWRVLVHNNPAHQQLIVVGERTDMRFTLAESIALQSILPSVLALPLLGLLIWLIVGRGLRPLQELARLLAGKKPNDLSPLQLDNTPKELRSLIDSTNDLLLRLENSFAREKRFSGDAAHELRTPLSALKIHIYNLSKQLPDGNENIRQVNTSIDRMTHLIEQMLALYRTTPEKFMANFAEVDLYSMTQQVITDNWQRIETKNQQIELTGSSCPLTGDRFALETLVKNLIDNANKYTPEHGSIVISINCSSGFAELCVEDSGIGIPEEFHQRVFERFYRVNGDQHNSMVVGCGLGLSIVQHIVELHGGTITLSPSRFASGLKVKVALPLDQPTGLPS